MNMRRRTLTAAALAALVVALPATSSDATHSRGKCKQRGQTLLTNDLARVYEVERSDGLTGLYGCLWSRNRAVALEFASDDGLTTSYTYRDVVLRLRHVAWGLTEEDISCKADCPPGYDAVRTFVTVANLGRQSERSVRTGLTKGSLKLTGEGDAAWLAPAEGGGSAVHAWDADGHRVVAQGAITRFRLRGDVLSWLSDGASSSMRLR